MSTLNTTNIKNPSSVINNIVLDASGNVTISGTLNPGSTLVVPSGTATAPTLSFTSDPNTGIYSPGADQIAIATNGTGRLFVDASGNVGIGTATPTQAVEAVGSFLSRTFSAAGNFICEAASGTVSTPSAISTQTNLANYTGRGYGNTGYRTCARIQIWSDGAITDASSPGFLLFLTTPSGSTGNIERMRISSVGTTTLTSAASTVPFVVNIGASEVARIDSFGRLLVGTSSALNVGGSAGFEGFQVAGTGSGSNVSLSRWAATNGAAGISFAKSRGASIGTNTVVVDGDSIGRVDFNAADGTSFISAAQIQAFVDGTPGTNDMPGRLVFSTTADGSASPAERMRLDSSGRLGLGTINPGAALDVLPPASTVCLRARSNSASDPVTALQVTPSNLSAEWFGLVSGPTQTTVNASTGNLVIATSGSERARIDSSGRLLVGMSSYITGNAYSIGQLLNVAGNPGQGIQVQTFSNDQFAAAIDFFKSRSATVGTRTIPNDGDALGNLIYNAWDGAAVRQAASIVASIDGTPGANDMPGRLVFSTTADGASSPTERFRITNDGVIAHDQPAPAAVNATATLTIANLKAGIITSTSALATDMTLPTGTDTQAGFSGTYDNFTFEWSVINTGPSLVRVLAGTAHTIVGSGSIATGTSGRFASRRTAANTFVTYRLS